MTPAAIISRPDHVEVFKKSEAAKVLLRFVSTVGQAIEGKLLTDPVACPPSVEAVVAMLAALEKWIADIPPIDQPQRFGNPAFKQWYARLRESAQDLVARLPGVPTEAIQELVPYLEDSFGNNTRIDYGSGHELSFVAWLCCLSMIGVFTPQDMTALGLRVFPRYLDVVRQLQRTYRLEPAGSHGVWGLDDHQFLPYLWGAAQLAGARQPQQQENSFAG